jgi:hypothetical protein
MVVDALPEGWTPVRVVLAVECFVPDSEDSRRLCIRSSEGSTIWDVMGLGRAIMLEADRHWVTTGEADDDA